MNAISNYNVYNTEMSKGLEDKLFFMERVDFTHLMDYGCADGMLIQAMAEHYPEKKYIGYDFDEKMINMAKDKKIFNSFFASDLAIANSKMNPNKEKNAILCSSLIHEVYSYGDEQSINEFWKNLYSGEYQHVIIRDMAMSNVDMEDDVFVKSSDVKKLFTYGDNKKIEQFQSIWGDIGIKRNFLHFLMKYRYLQNWDREVEENYFPLTVEDHLNKVSHDYEIVYFEHFLLPFQKEVVKKDFNIDLNTNTHIKIITKKIPR